MVHPSCACWRLSRIRSLLIFPIKHRIQIISQLGYHKSAMDRTKFLFSYGKKNALFLVKSPIFLHGKTHGKTHGNPIFCWWNRHIFRWKSTCCSRGALQSPHFSWAKGCSWQTGHLQPDVCSMDVGLSWARHLNIYVSKNLYLHMCVCNIYVYAYVYVYVYAYVYVCVCVCTYAYVYVRVYVYVCVIKMKNAWSMCTCACITMCQ